MLEVYRLLPVNLSLGKISLYILCALSSIAAPAFAAENEEDADNTITVIGKSAGSNESAWGPSATIAAKQSATVTKTDTPIEKTPQSLSIVTREEMETHQFRSVKEALSYSPGVTTSMRGASNSYDFMAIRGFSSSGPQQNNYLDGLKMQGDFYNDAVIDPYMLERVELMRGPTSVLYGKSNPGGIVSMVSKRPTDQPVREIQFKMGTGHLIQTGFDFSDALDDDEIYLFRLTGVARNNDEQQQNAKQKRYAIAPSFTWRPSDTTHVTLLSYFQNEPEIGYYGWLPKEGTVQPLPNGGKLPTDFNEGALNNHYARNQKMIGYSAEHGFNDTFTLRQNLRFSQMKVSQHIAYGTGLCDNGMNAFNSFCQAIAADKRGEYLGRGTVVDEERLQNFSVDTQLQSKFNTQGVAHTLLTGVDFMRMRNDISAEFGNTSSIDLNNLPAMDNVDFGRAVPYQLNETRQTGLYVQDQAEWQRWVLTVGGRYDWSKQGTTVRRDGGYIARDDRQFTWRSGLNYLFDNGISPYISYSQSFEPNVFSLYSTPRVAYQPSKGEQYEAGVKYVPKDKALVITGALYQLTKSNMLMADPNNALNQVPAGEVRVRGGEFEAKAAVNLNINLTASYSYTDAQYTRDTNLKGNSPVQIPKHTAALWGDYTFHNGALSGLTLGTGGRFMSSSYGDAANSFKVGSAAVMDAVVKYDLARIGMQDSSVALNFSNLLDREYVASCFDTYGCFYGAERQVIATATFRF